MRPIAALLLLCASAASANGLGVVGYAGNLTATCNNCHSGGIAPTVAFAGPSTLQAGQTGDYTLTVTGGAGVRAGMNVAVDVVEAQLLGVAGETVSFSNEVHQAAPRAFSGTRASFRFRLLAPPFSGTVRLFGAGNSCNGNGASSGDRAGVSTMTVTVTGGATTPRIATPASASSATVTGTTAQLSVLGADDQPETALTYTWSLATGPSSVVFSPNGTNAAKRTAATFSQAGEHTLRVLVTDAQGQSTASTVRVVVQSTFSTIAVTPLMGEVQPGGALQFSARAVDQFGGSMMAPATFAWSTTGGGTISSTGRYLAGARLGGPHVIQAVAMGRSGAGAARVVEQPARQDTAAPVVSLRAPASGARLAGRVTLEVEASDDVGVTRVEVLLGEASLGEVSQAPWRLVVDTAAHPSGPAVLTALAFDAAGNRGAALPVEVVFDNPTTLSSAEAASGCASAPGLPLLGLSLLLRVRRRRR